MSAVASMLFDSWIGLGRVLLVGVLAYVSLVAILRISGKRTLTSLTLSISLSRSRSDQRSRRSCSARM